ncbi:hypothetical protein [Mesorhizobium wenxiniae]|nr:hypothetical protein [Mesorhizobium wenxiniae]
MSDDEAVQHYGRTGQMLGVFDTPANADMYAQELHKTQDRYYQQQQRLPWQDYQAAPQQDVAAQTAAELSAITQSFDTGVEGNPVADAERARAEGMAGWKQPIVAASDAISLFGHGASFGFADKAAAGVRSMVTGQPYDEELADIRNQLQGARDRAPWAGMASELTGAVAGPAKLAGKGLTLAGRGGTAAMEGVKGVLARAGMMVPEAAAYGALSAAGNDQDIGTGAGIGAVAGGLGSVAGDAVSAGASKVAGAFSKKPAIPSLDEISALKTAAYDRADQAGVAFTPTAVDRLRSNIAADFADRGFLPANEPGAAAVLKEIENLKGQNVTLKGLDTIRKMAGNAYIPGNKSNNALTSKIINQIDELIAKPGTSDVLMGDANAGWRAISEARSLASREMKANKVSEALSKAELRAASTGSGGNADNATRQNLRRVLEKPRGFTADEQAALEKVVRGTPGQNALRLAGKLSPSGNGLMAALGVGGAMVNPMVGIASLGGMGAKSVADSMTNRNVQQILDIIAAGGQKSATQAAPNALQRLAQSEREPLSRLLMSLGVNLGNAGLNAPRK